MNDLCITSPLAELNCSSEDRGPSIRFFREDCGRADRVGFKLPSQFCGALRTGRFHQFDGLNDEAQSVQSSIGDGVMSIRALCSVIVTVSFALTAAAVSAAPELRNQPKFVPPHPPSKSLGVGGAAVTHSPSSDGAKDLKKERGLASVRGNAAKSGSQYYTPDQLALQRQISGAASKIPLGNPAAGAPCAQPGAPVHC